MRLRLVLGSAITLGGRFSVCKFLGAERGCLSRFLKGGRGWKNPAKAEKPSTQAPNELRSPDQVHPCAFELRCVLWRAQRDEPSGCVVYNPIQLRGRAGAEGAQAKGQAAGAAVPWARGAQGR